MSEIHRDRELEHLESMLYTYKVENKSMDAENERLKHEIRKLLAEKDKLRAALENAQQARVSQGKAIIDANNEIERLRAGNRDLQLWWDNLRPDHARLEAENAKLREAVSWLANLDMDRFTEHDEALLETAIEEARAALGGEND